MRLMGQAIDRTKSEVIACRINNYAQEWYEKLRPILIAEEIDKSILEQVYPLHPLTALVLPTLCYRYAQNDRSLFTFLTSDEPFSLRKFLDEVEVTDNILPTLKIETIENKNKANAKLWLDDLNENFTKIEQQIEDEKLNLVDNLLKSINKYKSVHINYLSDSEKNLLDKVQTQCIRIQTESEENQIITLFNQLPLERKQKLYDKLTQYLE